MKKIAIGIVVLMVLAGAALLVMRGMIDEDAVKQRFVTAVTRLTGMEPVILGDAQFSVFPVPRLTIAEVGIKNMPGASVPYIASIKKVVVYPELSSLLSADPVVSRIVMSDSIVEFEKMPDGWNFALLLAAGSEKASQAQETSARQSLEMHNIRLHVIDEKAEMETEYPVSAFNLSQSGGTYTLQTQGQAHNTPLSLLLEFSTPKVDSDSPFKFSLQTDSAQFSVDGNSALAQKGLLFKGNLIGDVKDMRSLMLLFSDTPAADADTAAAAAHPIPLMLKSNISLQDDVLKMDGITIDSPLVSGKGSLSGVVEKSPQLTLDMHLKLLDADAFMTSGLQRIIGAQLFAVKPVEKPDWQKSAASGSAKNGSLTRIFAGTQVALKLKADEIRVNAQVIRDAQFSADFSKEDTVVDQASAKLPGDSSILFIGIIKESFQGLTFEGTTDVSGQNFDQFTALFGLPAAVFPAEDFRRFRVKSNVVLSPKEARFTEAALQVEEMRAAGAVIASYDKEFVLEAVFRAAGINLDRWLSGGSQALSANDMPSLLVGWAKANRLAFKIRGTLEKFTFNQQPRERAEIQIEGAPNNINIKRLATVYNGTALDGGVWVDTGEKQPRFGVNLKADKLDTAAFLGVADAAPAQDARYILGDGKWSKEEFDFSWLETLNLTLDAEIGQFNHHGRVIDNLLVKAVIADRTLNVENIAGRVFGADLQAKARLTGGKLPALSAAVAFNNVAVEQLVSITPAFNAMVGRFNLSSSFATSGVNPYSWVANAKGTLGLGGRDVLVKGFNLPGIVRSVGAVRSVADILNVVRLAFPGGDTQFSTIQGKFAIGEGFARTSGDFELQSNVSSGILEGQINLLDWSMKMDLDFKLNALASAAPPSLVLRFSGNLEKPQKSLDTKSLEEFVAIKTREKLLQDFPGGQ